MKLEAEPLLQPDPALAGMRAIAPGWRMGLPLVLAAVVAIIAVYWPTAESIVGIWWRSETFTHGFLILPISVALIWMQRREIAKLSPSTDYLGFVLMAGAGLAWLVAAAGEVQVVKQFAMVAMIPASVIAIAGRRVAIALTFPLAFLFLGVPVGEGLIPPLMEWTADFTVAALQFTGMPVYREGLFFSIPSGNWSIVEGCSGVRYLIASITVGALFAYLNYRSFGKRILFVLLSIVIPIVANGLRAYMIVMIAHLSDGRLAHGVDHFIYGWFFFGLVMLLLFWAGSFWRDEREAGVFPGKQAGSQLGVPAPRKGMAIASVAVVAIAAVWPVYAAYLDRASEYRGTLVVAPPAPVAGWSFAEKPLTDWRPRYEGAAASVFQVYHKGDRAVALYAGFYPRQRKGAELLTSTNIMVVQKHPVWLSIEDLPRREDLGNGPVDIRETKLRSPGQRLLVWDWVRVAEQDLSSRYVAKLLLARDKLLGRGDDGSTIILATPYEGRPEVAADTLRQFVGDMRPSIDAMLTHFEADLAAARR